MKAKVFISRGLKKGSAFRTRLEALGLEVIGQSLIAFSPVAFPALPPVDWLFFYSKKAVRFFFEGLGGQAPPAGVRWAALGQGTAAELAARGVTLDFTGAGEPEGVAEAFAKEAAGQRALFPQARHSRQSIQQLLEGRIHAFSLVVYDNQPRETFELPFCEVLVFTSPLNAQVYFGKYDLQEGQLVVAIGGTTEAALHELGVKKVYKPEEPSEKSLALTVAALLKS